MAVTLDVLQAPCLAVVYQWTPDLPFSEVEFRQMIDEVNVELAERGEGNDKGWYYIPLPVVGPRARNWDRRKTLERNSKLLAEVCTRLNKMYGDRASFSVQKDQLKPVRGGILTGGGKNRQPEFQYSIVIQPRSLSDADTDVPEQ